MMVLDTNVVSGLMHPRPDPSLLRWMAAHDAANLFTTTVTQAEILYGIALMDEGRRKAQLGERAADMFALDFADRVLVFDAKSAACYARIAAERRRAGRPIGNLDAEIAAIARSASADLVTRNIRDFELLGIPLHNPWDY